MFDGRFELNAQMASDPGVGVAANHEEQAKQVITESVRGFYFVAATQAVMGLVLGGGTAIVLDAVVMFVLAAWLQRSYGRAPATVLLLLGVTSVAFTLANAIGVTAVGGGGRGVVVAAIFVWLGVRATRAAFRLAELRG